MRFDAAGMRSLHAGLRLATDVQGAVTAFHASVARPLGAASSVACRITPSGVFEVVASIGVGPPSNALDLRRPGADGYLEQVAGTQRPLFVDDLGGDPGLRSLLAGDGNTAALLVALTDDDVAFAVLAVCWPAGVDRAIAFRAEAAAPLLATRLAQLLGLERAPSRVLVVEHEPLLGRLLDLALSAEGFAVRVRSGWAGTADVIRSWRPALVVADTSPDAAVPRIGPPVLYIGDGAVGTVPLGVGDGYVQKPFHPRDLVDTVKRMLRGERASALPSTGEGDLLERYALDLATVTVEERVVRAALEDAYLHTVQTLAAAAEARDLTTG